MRSPSSASPRSHRQLGSAFSQPPLPAWSDAPPSPRAGVNQLTWTGRSRDGGALAKGPYLLEILAVEETGRAVRAVRAFWVR